MHVNTTITAVIITATCYDFVSVFFIIVTWKKFLLCWLAE